MSDHPHPEDLPSHARAKGPIYCSHCGGFLSNGVECAVRPTQGFTMVFCRLDRPVMDALGRTVRRSAFPDLCLVRRARPQ
jgi:hypothetical protein